MTGGREMVPGPVAWLMRWLLDTGAARFGLLSVGWLLLFACILAWIPFDHAAGPRAGQTVTLLSWLPESLLRWPGLYTLACGWLFLSALGWMAWIGTGYRGVRWIAWSTVAAFTAVWSLRLENLTNGAHIFNATNTLLFIHALWFHFREEELVRAFRAGRGWSAAVYPRWVFWLSVFYLGWFHSLAGFTKLAVSGSGWSDGASLQLWIHLFGDPRSPLTWPVVESRTTARILQTAALWIECCSILCIFGRWPRYLVGLGLIGFYTGVLGTFTMFGFHFNWVLVAWFLLPVDRLIGLEFSAPAAESQSTPRKLEENGELQPASSGV